eukprot:scaffold19495_cov102-Isochrysis_galbana.AAC.4
MVQAGCEGVTHRRDGAGAVAQHVCDGTAWQYLPRASLNVEESDPEAGGEGAGLRKTIAAGEVAVAVHIRHALKIGLGLVPVHSHVPKVDQNL